MGVIEGDADVEVAVIVTVLVAVSVTVVFDADVSWEVRFCARGVHFIVASRAVVLVDSDSTASPLPPTEASSTEEEDIKDAG